SEFLVPWIRRQKEERATTLERWKFRRRVLSIATVVLLLGCGVLIWRTVTLSEKALEKKAVQDARLAEQNARRRTAFEEEQLAALQSEFSVIRSELAKKT